MLIQNESKDCDKNTLQVLYKTAVQTYCELVAAYNLKMKAYYSEEDGASDFEEDEASGSEED